MHPQEKHSHKHFKFVLSFFGFNIFFFINTKQYTRFIMLNPKFMKILLFLVVHSFLCIFFHFISFDFRIKFILYYLRTKCLIHFNHSHLFVTSHLQSPSVLLSVVCFRFFSIIFCFYICILCD